MTRKCRLKTCRKELSPLKEADGWPKAGYCHGRCKIEHDRQKAAGRKPMTRKAIPKKRSKPKRHGWRSEAYLRWVRQQPCCYCGRSPAGDAHHLIGLGAGVSGVGLTAPDHYAMALCRTHHEQVHGDPELQKMQWQWMAQTLASAIDEGIIGKVSNAAA